MRRTLRQHDVQVCSSGAEALARLGGGERFDVIFCDLMMPEMSGMELYEQLSAQHAEQAARMVFVTGGAFTPAAQAFLSRVSNARLDKPYETEELLAQVYRLLEDRRAQTAAS